MSTTFSASQPLLPPHTVFVSHAHADNALCDRYVNALKKRGLDVWYDRNNLQLGDSLSETIETQLRQRTALVVLYTPASVDSKWVRREVGAFQHLADRDPSRLLIAVRAADCEVPLLMMEALWADAVRDGFDAAIDTMAKALRAPARPPVSPPANEKRTPFPAPLPAPAAPVDQPVVRPLPATPSVTDNADEARVTLSAAEQQAPNDPLADQTQHALLNQPRMWSGVMVPLPSSRGKPQPQYRPLIAGAALVLVVVTLGALLLQHVSGLPFASNGVPTVTGTLSAVGPWKVTHSPTNSDLHSVAMVSASDGWAVGDSGIILHFTSGQWRIVTSPTNAALQSVAMDSATDGWAVCDNGTILHYSGGQWNTVSSPTMNYLASVAMVSATDGWAVGDAGTILHYTSGQWRIVTSPIPVDLSSVAMISATDGWAVGGYGTILHYTGGQWVVVDNPALGFLDSVAMVSSSEGWAVGLNGTILHYKDGQWDNVNSPINSNFTRSNFTSVAMTSATEGWAVGWAGTILQYIISTGEWSSVSNTTNLTLYGVAMVSPKDGWAVGGNGTILHYSGG